MIHSSTVPDYQRLEPILCDHRQAPWIPLCEHAGRTLGLDLTEGDVGRRVEVHGTGAVSAGVLLGVHHLDDQAVQLLISPEQGNADLITAPHGTVIRLGHPLP